ncbi:PREDICTED: uncharacterized protein LOC108563668 [Nicrophorus vespilloides]|uniref:Uncharacterized protein LOC108563668 n=1 Tax=Nicrophorus vespilloides TaxID=110193 RepID=A0ABM1MTJ5_NICVS|nr:PREDICTED: uncharacterized protein LOC108563668 [Nicrophorus vespilloides]
MRLYLGLVLVLVAAVNSLQHGFRMRSFNKRLLEPEINKTLECIRENLITGRPEEGVPSFKPLHIQNISIDFSQLGFEDAHGLLDLKGIELGGLTDWDLQALEVNLGLEEGVSISVEAFVNIPNLKVLTGYVANVTVENVYVWGDGDLEADLGNFGIKLDTKINTSGPKIEHIKILISLESFKAKLTGLFDDDEHSELVTQLLNQIVLNWVNEKSEDISDALEALLKDLVNNAQQYGFDTILEECINK